MKYLILILIFTIELLAQDNYELKLYQNILPKIFQKNSLIVYTEEKSQIAIIKNSNILKLSSSCSDADVVIGKKLANLPEECYNKPIFATSYRGFKNSKNAFGAFYWSKGRPQVQFKLDVIKRYQLYLPSDLRKYAK